MQFEHNCFTASSKKPLPRVAPIEVVHYAQENENLRLAVRLMAGEHKAAAKTLVYRDVAGFLAYQIASSSTARKCWTNVHGRAGVQVGDDVNALKKPSPDHWPCKRSWTTISTAGSR